MKPGSYRRTPRGKPFTAAALALALVGCGSTRLSNELKPYVGHPVRDLVAHLGKPTGRREEERVYVWTTDSDGVLASQPFADGPGGGGGVSYAGSSTRAGLIPVQFECTIEVTVDPADVIQKYHFEGSNAGCARYRQMLGR